MLRFSVFWAGAASLKLHCSEICLSVFRWPWKGLGRKTGTMSPIFHPNACSPLFGGLEVARKFLHCSVCFEDQIVLLPWNHVSIQWFYIIFFEALCSNFQVWNLCSFWKPWTSSIRSLLLNPLFFLEALEKADRQSQPLEWAVWRIVSTMFQWNLKQQAWRRRTKILWTLCSNEGLFVRGRFGPSTISMKISCCDTEVDLDKWTKAAKCKILEACRSELAESEGPVLNTLFEQPNLVLSWLESNHLRKVHELVPKVNIIFLFRPRDDFSYEWEKWARGHNVFLVLHDLEPDDPHWNSKPLDEMGVMRHSFAAACTDTINTLNTFFEIWRILSSVQGETDDSCSFACDGTSKSVGALLASIMFFGHCDANTALSHLLKKPRVWKPLPLVDHTYILEALFHQEQCIRAAIGR